MTLSSEERADEFPWWRMPATTWMSLACLALLSIICCLRPMLVDTIALGLVRLADFRFWPWWFFLELAIASSFSVRWFLLLTAPDRDTWTELQTKESKAFFALTGTICMLMLLLAVLDRFGLLRPMYDSLFYCFRSGEPSLNMLLVSAGPAVLLSLLFALLLNWISTLIHRN